LNVLILNNMAPFVRGGAEELASHLCAHLNSTPGVQAEVLRVPFSWEPFERLADEIFLNRTLQLSNADRVIGLKFPAYLIPHHNKVLWVLHQYRQAYDLRDRGQSNIPATAAGQKICELVRRADAEVFASCRSLFAQSKTIQDRLKRYNGVAAPVLMQPMNRPDLFSDCGDGGYIFAGGRVNAGKRQHLLVQAMAATKSGAKLIVAGPPDTPDDANRLQAIVRSFKLEDRVTLDFGYHPLTKIADYVNHARVCGSVPVDEDCLAYVTMEAASASKPIIALTDSGGILQLVLDGETGCVVSPDPKSIAEAIDLLFSDPARSARMGRAARKLLDSFELTWSNTIEKLLA
jgi:glycosyltransferase involved in cell wall biosynthesis